MSDNSIGTPSGLRPSVVHSLGRRPQSFTRSPFGSLEWLVCPLAIDTFVLHHI
nr:MAG TPA: hypothetical protein [Caudoviricetes sp.]